MCFQPREPDVLDDRLFVNRRVVLNTIVQRLRNCVRVLSSLVERQWPKSFTRLSWQSQPVHHPQQDTFSAARLSRNHRCFAGPDRQTEIIEAAFAVSNRHPDEFNDKVGTRVPTLSIGKEKVLALVARHSCAVLTIEEQLKESLLLRWLQRRL